MKEIVSVKKQAEKIVALKMRGVSVSSLARRYNVSPRFMRDLLAVHRRIEFAGRVPSCEGSV